MTPISYVLAISTCIFFLWYGIHEIPGSPDLTTIWNIGLGAVDVRTLISWKVPRDNIVANVLIANISQPVLSIIYFTYNSIWTTMSLGKEWSKYGFRRHGLRVSGRPRGSQRMSYFLQLPYRYSIPVMVLSGVLHWLVSQSIFLVAVNRYDRDGNPAKDYYSYSRYEDGISEYSDDIGEWLSCGFSPVAILAVILVGVAMVLLLLAQGFRRFESGIPLAGTSSGAIAAACHVAQGEDGGDARYKPVAWGVTGHYGEIGHCAFSSNVVEEPRTDALYMGVDKREKLD